MCISTKRLKFLDITNFLAGGTSLDSLYKSYNVKTLKGIFPYEWFNSLDKIQETKLPRREEFLVLLRIKQLIKRCTMNV